ncbi:Green heme protein [Variovorax sp. PBS-H4]|uniref:cytochrome C n=1 Tax=Variovorax sp. PBS-H4 TaxID=434008 RepID=UPI0013198EBB|nr:cytochrome C [Variovorax sp. PBS-H4]VTU36265.1 Green heme protein [Variovorax sp. PBS-H4]
MARELIRAGVTTAMLLGACLSLPVLAQSRGELLYSTHCIACHTAQVHWRERKLVTDWTSLRAQVWRWQTDAALGWNDDDVAEVARYLNDEFYRFPQAAGSAGLGGFASRWEGKGQSRTPSDESLRPSATKDRETNRSRR